MLIRSFRGGRLLSAWLLCGVGLMAASGCRSTSETTPSTPQYARALPPGAAALRKVTNTDRAPAIAPLTLQLHDPAFRQALTRSGHWFAMPSAQRFFPIEGITWEQAHASVRAIEQAPQDPIAAEAFLREQFDVYESVGWDGSGTVLFTGYYAPTFRASRVPTPIYRFPLYQRPADLITDPRTGQVVGTYPTRAELLGTGRLAGLELVYFASRLDAYLVEVNGSAQLQLTDGTTEYVGYAGSNGRDYTSLGRELARDGKLDPNRVSLPAIRAYFDRYPNELAGYINRNDRFVFFKPYEGAEWPAGSLGVRVEAGRTIATDKSVFPRGGLVWAETRTPEGQPLRRLMLDQDTGGAIRAPGRADLFLGIGQGPADLAGRLASEGRMFYFFLKPEFVAQWAPQPVVP